MPEVAEELLERVGWFTGSLEGMKGCSDDGGVSGTDSVAGLGFGIEAVKVRDVCGVRHLLGVDEVGGRVVFVLWKDDVTAEGIMDKVFPGGGALFGAANASRCGRQFNEFA